MPSLLQKGLTCLLLAYGALGAGGAPSGPVSNNPRVEFKVKFKPKADVNNFLGENDLVKYHTKKAVIALFEDQGINEEYYDNDKVKTKWDHGAIDGEYFVAYIYFQFKYGYYDKAQKLYDAISKFDYDDGADADVAATFVKDYMKSKLDPGYSYHEDPTGCGSNGMVYAAVNSVICQGYTSCLGIDVSGCTDPADCDVCNNEEKCTAVARTRNECEVNSSANNDDANACRDASYGNYFKSATPMSCTGAPGYEEAYICNALDLAKYCWPNQDNTCSACTDLYYYTTANPLKNCYFNYEKKDDGKCLTGFCRNENCYVKKVQVALTNMGDGDRFVTGHWITIVYMATAFLTIVLTQLCPPASGSSQLNEVVNEH